SWPYALRPPPIGSCSVSRTRRPSQRASPFPVENLGQDRGKTSWVVAWGAAGVRHVGEDEPPAEGPGGLLEQGRVLHHGPVREHHVHAQVRGVLLEHLQVLLGGEAVGLARLRGEVEVDQA